MLMLVMHMNTKHEREEWLSTHLQWSDQSLAALIDNYGFTLARFHGKLVLMERIDAERILALAQEPEPEAPKSPEETTAMVVLSHETEDLPAKVVKSKKPKHGDKGKMCYLLRKNTDKSWSEIDYSTSDERKPKRAAAASALNSAHYYAISNNKEWPIER